MGGVSSKNRSLFFLSVIIWYSMSAAFDYKISEISSESVVLLKNGNVTAKIFSMRNKYW